MSATTTLEQRLLAAAKKAGRERDALKAVSEYEAEKRRVDANTARLRALRLAKEADEAAAAAAAQPAAKPKASRASASARRT
jgi:hypothetical protein